MRERLRSRRELAIVAAALLLPVPLLTASGLLVPLPSAVERAFVSLIPGGDVETGSASRPGRGTGPDTAGNDQTSAGALVEGGNAPPPASGSGAAASDDSSADDVLPEDERIVPGGSETELPAAPASPRDGGTQQEPDADDRDVAAASISTDLGRRGP